MGTKFPGGSGVTRITPPKLSGGGGGTVIQYTSFTSPWTVDDPWEINRTGDTYENGANATFFIVDAPVTETPF